MNSAKTSKRSSVFAGMALMFMGALCGPVPIALAQNPVPMINLPLVPDATAPGGPNFTLTLNGSGFVSNSTVNWNGSPLATTFVSTSRLTAAVPAADIATAGTAQVTVSNPAPGGSVSNTTFFSTATPASASPVFSPVRSPNGYYPNAIAVGDFNGDGNLDLAVSQAYGGGTEILLGHGTGNFTSVSSLPQGGDGVAVGDFNGDGKLDLALATWSSVSILLGDGTGNFTLASTVDVGGATVVAGDFNGDGNLDVATIDGTNSDTVYVLLGDGTGNLTLASSLAVQSATALVAGDFNGDGKLDLAVGTWTWPPTVSILLGDGTGNFTLASSSSSGCVGAGMASGDLNGDGNLDLALVDGWNGSTACVLLGDGTGNFTLSSTLSIGAAPEAVAIADLNGDGNLDIATTNYSSDTVSVYLGDGQGNFTASPSPSTGAGPWGLAIGDFNNDGRPDFAVGDYYFGGPISILLQNIPQATVSPASLTFPSQLVLTTSRMQTITLTNPGGAALNNLNIAASANFYEKNNCGSSLAPAASCTIDVVFRPRALGSITGAITVTDNAFNSPQSASLTGAGTAIGLTPPVLNFGKVIMGQSSGPKTVTLTNHSTVPLQILSLGADDPYDFLVSTDCGTSLPAGASCTINVTFAPGWWGPYGATLSVTDPNKGSPQTVELSGIGLSK